MLRRTTSKFCKCNKTNIFDADTWFLLQDLVPANVLPKYFLRAIKTADYSSVSTSVQAYFDVFCSSSKLKSTHMPVCDILIWEKHWKT